jgi:hypothetical protein
MPLLQNKYQPYFPDPDSPANQQCEGEYCHPISDGDQIITQFNQTPCAANEIADPEFSEFTLGTELITNGNFASGASWSFSGVQWSIGGGKATHSAGGGDPLYQTGLAMTVGNYYQIVVDVVRTAGSIFVQIGQTAGSTAGASITTSGTYTFTLPFNDAGVGDNNIYLVPSTDFAGSVDNVSMKEVTYDSWDPNGSWMLQDGLACHISGTSGTLEESVADYIIADGYYSIRVAVTGLVSGSVDVMISDVVAGTIDANGIRTLYATPTVDGVVSFVPSINFVGCISFPDYNGTWGGLRALRNDYLMEVVDSDGNRYDISDDVAYFENYVTLNFNFETYELGYGCYTVEVLDRCLVEGINLIENGDFTDGSAHWILNNGGGQYTFAGGTCTFRFSPIEGSNYILNGTFATNDFTNWTAGANWSAATGKAVHTAGSTATLVQSVVIPPPTVAPTSYSYWARITMSARTAGYVILNLGDTASTVQLATNGVLMVSLHPTTSGAVNFTITPSSTFDGAIDDVELYYTNVAGWSTYPIITSEANVDIVAGNYEIEFDIVSQTDSRIQVAALLLGSGVGYTAFNTVGTHTISVPNYVPGAQQLRMYGQFELSNYSIDGEVVIDNVILRRVEPFEATYISECLNYQFEHTGTKMVVAYCDQAAMGFEFTNTGFVFQQRVECRSLASSYPQELGIQKSGTGNARITYAAIEKYWIFATGFISETAHDSLACMRLMDHFLIGEGPDNGKEYIIDSEEYAPEWRGEGDYNLATVAYRIRIKTEGQKFNRHT